jgi:hypothetical protein
MIAIAGNFCDPLIGSAGLARSSIMFPRSEKYPSRSQPGLEWKENFTSHHALRNSLRSVVQG